MILSCCFGNNKQKRKEEAGQTSLHLQEYDDEVSARSGLQLSGIAAIISE